MQEAKEYIGALRATRCLKVVARDSTRLAGHGSVPQTSIPAR
jgi:hypothetical protein